MKRGKHRVSSRKKLLTNKEEKTPSAMHSILFNTTQKSHLMESVVVPETPNNSYHYPTSDVDMTAGTVLETPDSPEEDIPKCHSSSAAESIVPPQSKERVSPNEDAFDLLLKSSKILLHEKKEKGGGQYLSDEEEEEDSVFDITPDLHLGRRKNVMSILESEHSFALSLQNQNKKNSSMISGNQQIYRNVSPVKRRKRRSFAQVILPFDLNDAECLSAKLHNIEESEQATRQVNANRQLRRYNHEPATSAKLTRRSSIKRQTSTQVSKSSSQQFKVCETEIHTKKQKSIDGDKSESNVTVFFDSEDLDLTPIRSHSQARINNSVQDIIEGLASQNLLEVESDVSVEIRMPSLCYKDADSGPQQKQVLERPQASRGIIADRDSGNSGSSSSVEYPPTQPADTLILQGVVAYVEVRIGSDNHSEVMKDQLRTLGAQVKEKLTSDVTHVIFKDGNKSTFNLARKRGLHLVSSLWVEACRENFRKISEALYPSGSIDSYTNLVLPSRLRKLKSMQPKDFPEEERIATARARRRLKSQKSTVQSPPSCKFDSFTTNHGSTDSEDVNSPLFGIGHLLTPQRRSRVSLSSCEEESETSAEECMETSLFNTPLSKRLYNRFLTPRQNTNTPGRGGKENESINITADLSLEDSAFGNRDSTNETSQSKANEEECSNDILVKPLNLGNKDSTDNAYSENIADINSVNVDSAPVFLEPNLKAHLENENNIAQIIQQKPHLLKPRRSARLSQKFDGQNQHMRTVQYGDNVKQNNTSQLSSVDFSSERSKHGTSTTTTSEVSVHLPECSVRENGLNSSASDQNAVITNVVGCSGQSNPVGKNLLESSKAPAASTSDHINESNKPEHKIGSVRRTMKKKRKNRLSGPLKKSLLKELDMSFSTSSVVVNDENRAHTSGPSSQRSMRGDEQICPGMEKSISDSNSMTFVQESSCSSSSQKSKGHRLMSVDYIEPSQELIVPSTPRQSKSLSQGPYADLHIHGSRTQRAALKELKVRSLSACLPKKNGIVKCAKDKKGGGNSRIGSLIVDDVFFSSSDEEPTSLRANIFPLPKTRKSIEEFKVKKPSRLPRRSSLKSNNSLDSSICLTSIHSKEMKCIIPIIKKLGKYQITSVVDNSTTHVVCGGERRTLNLLFGIARGSWIIDKSWLYESLEMEKWAPEEPFEIFTYCPGAKICREQREVQGASYKQTLFSGVGCVCVFEGCVPSSQDLRDLLELCGCRVVPNVRNANLVVCNPAASVGVRNRMCQVMHVSEKWILDSIQHHKIQNIHNYAIQD